MKDQLMTTLSMARLEDKYVDVPGLDGSGLRLRYLEEGQGAPALFLHGASLGSSADVFARNIPAFAQAGLRAVAFDQPGFGLSQVPSDHSVGLRRKSVPAFIDALGLGRVALVAHSQAGGMAVQLAIESPDKYSHVVILGTGSLLPPLKEEADGREAVVQQRLERRMAQQEPSVQDTRKLLEANLFHHELITEEALAMRHARSVGANFAAFVARGEAPEAPKKPGATPLWKRLADVPVPMLLIYGKQDRANAFERAMMLKETFPQLDLHIAEGCKHLVPWDAEAEVARLVIPFLKR